MFDRTHLQKVVHYFRNAIEPCWSEDTAYAVSGIRVHGAYLSAGQCAVTCLVLKDVLASEFPETPSFLVRGQTLSDDGRVLIDDHVWLRLGVGEDAVIIDPTIDQAEEVDDTVLIGTEEELLNRGLRYLPKEVETDHGETEHPKRYQRYRLLKRAYMKEL